MKISLQMGMDTVLKPAPLPSSMTSDTSVGGMVAPVDLPWTGRDRTAPTLQPVEDASFDLPLLE